MRIPDEIARRLEALHRAASDIKEGDWVKVLDAPALEWTHDRDFYEGQVIGFTREHGRDDVLVRVERRVYHGEELELQHDGTPYKGYIAALWVLCARKITKH